MDNLYNVPELQNCCGCFRLRFGLFLISFLAIISGCFGLTAIVIYGLAEQNILTNLLGRQINGLLRKIIITVSFITSSMLTSSGCLTLIGSITKGKSVLTWTVYMMVVMCNVVLVVVISAPLSCFLTNYCIIRELSAVLLTLFLILITLFLLMWFYFIFAVYSFRREVISGE